MKEKKSGGILYSLMIMVSLGIISWILIDYYDQAVLAFAVLGVITIFAIWKMVLVAME